MKTKITYILTLILFLAAMLIPAAMDVTPVAAAGSIIAHDHAGITYSGTWTNWSNCATSGKSCHYSNTTGNYFQYTFTGDNVRIYALYNAGMGKAGIYLDSTLMDTVDLYNSASTGYEAIAWNSGVISAGSHTVKITVTGDKNANSAGYYVEFTKFVFDDGVLSDGNVIWTNDNNQILTYSGTWTHTGSLADYFDGDSHTSSIATDYVEFRFWGPNISLIAAKDAGLGKADIYIDGTVDSTIDLYDPALQAQVEVYKNTTLTTDYHTIKVVVRGDKNASSTDVTVDIDAFRYIDGMQKANIPDPAFGFACVVGNGVCTVDGDGTHLHSEKSGTSTNLDETFTLDPRNTYVDVTFIITATKREQSVSGGNRVSEALRIYTQDGSVAINEWLYSGTGTDVSATETYNQVIRLRTSGLTGQIHVYLWPSPDYPATDTISYTLDAWIGIHMPCSLRYVGQEEKGPFVIDPTIEFPQGPTGSPADEQTYPVTGGKTYVIRVGGDPWHNNSSVDHGGVQFSYDNITWQKLEDDKCIINFVSGPYFYTAYVIIPAGVETLYLRVDDDPGQFADNYMDAGEHLVYWIALQTDMYSDACGYMTLTNAGPYVIDPTIEFPKGSSGSPPDEQTFPVVNGAFYGIRTAGGPWHNGDTPDAERYDAAISWDNVHFTPLAEAALCSAVNADDANNSIFYVQAAGDNLYIRVNDHPEFLGVHYFSDNMVDAEYDYYISLVIYQGEVTCGSQYTYDPETDWVASVNVPANESDIISSQALIPGEWYVLEVASGSWKQDGAGADRYDAQFAFSALDGSPDTSWQTLEDGQDFVYCTETNGNYVTAYIQADAIFLHLRVNDDASTFSTNTGQLGINIYHTGFSRKTATCELQFEVDNLMGHGEIDATQENGVQIGHSITMPGTGAEFLGTQWYDFSGNPIGTPSPYDVALEPGMWYMLETTGGPWRGVGSTTNVRSYEAAISTISSDAFIPLNDQSYNQNNPYNLNSQASDWMDLKDWTYPACNIQTDSLGHRRIFFQVPTDRIEIWKMRVADTEMWTNNGGSLGYNLYRVYDKKTTMPNGSCDYIYDAEHPVNGPSPIFIASSAETGQVLLSTLEQNTLYAVVIRSDQHWTDSGGASGTALYTAEISDDNGSTWHDLPSGYGGVMCYVQNGNSTVMFIQTGSHYLYKMRVNSTTWSDNWGGLNVDLYKASVGDTINPFDSCLDGLSKYPIDPHEWIDVHKAEGQLIPISDVYSADQTVLGFVVEIETGTGPWQKNDGSSPDSHYDAEISHDGGTTWQLIDKYTSDSLIICGGEDHLGIYKWIYFKTGPDAVWKIRVNDDTDANFPGHGGNLAYALYTVTESNVAAPDCVVDTNRADCLPPGVAIAINGQDACTFAVIKPTAPSSLVDVPAWVGYASDWVRFGIDVYLQFMAWCPKHTNALMALMNMLKNKEPLATMTEFEQVINEVKRQLNAYDWNDADAPTILATKQTGFVDTVMNKIFPPMSSSSPWAGGPLVNFTTWTPTAYYNDCVTSFEDMLGPLLPKGVCFASDWMRETGFSLFFQIVLDLVIGLAVFRDIYGGASNIAHFMSGVMNPEIKVNVRAK